jgi:spoIIIJ-associated protein
MSEDTQFTPIEEGEMARGILVDILGKMGFPGTVEMTETPEQVVLTVSSEEPLALLIGKGGQTLNALELLVRTITQNKRHAYGKHITVDAEGYRAQHTGRLEELAREAAQRVKESATPITMDPMPARDRRTVHMTAVETPGITTYSTGEEPYRRVVIIPEGYETEEEQGQA